MELVPVVHPDIGTLLFRVYWEYAIEVEVVLNEVCIAENVGGGLAVSFCLEFSQSYVQLRLRDVEVVHNFLIQQVYGYFVWFEQHFITHSGVHTFILQDENTWKFNQQQFGVTVALSICALSWRTVVRHM